jgi:hypothetical protein
LVRRTGEERFFLSDSIPSPEELPVPNWIRGEKDIEIFNVNLKLWGKQRNQRYTCVLMTSQNNLDKCINAQTVTRREKS